MKLPIFFQKLRDASAELYRGNGWEASAVYQNGYDACFKDLLPLLHDCQNYLRDRKCITSKEKRGAYCDECNRCIILKCFNILRDEDGTIRWKDKND